MKNLNRFLFSIFLDISYILDHIVRYQFQCPEQGEDMPLFPQRDWYLRHLLGFLKHRMDRLLRRLHGNRISLHQCPQEEVGLFPHYLSEQV